MVVRLNDLNIEFLIKGRRDLFGQLHQKVHPKRHIARTHQHGVAGGRVQCCDLRITHAGGANHMDAACLCGQLGKGNRGLGCGEINHRLRFRERRQCIVGDRHAKRRAAHGDANVLTDPIVTFALHHACKLGLVAFQHRLDQHLPHAPRSAGDHDPWFIRHGFTL